MHIGHIIGSRGLVNVVGNTWYGCARPCILILMCPRAAMVKERRTVPLSSRIPFGVCTCVEKGAAVTAQCEAESFGFAFRDVARCTVMKRDTLGAKNFFHAFALLFRNSESESERERGRLVIGHTLDRKSERVTTHIRKHAHERPQLHFCSASPTCPMTTLFSLLFCFLFAILPSTFLPFFSTLLLFISSISIKSRAKLYWHSAQLHF